MNEKFLYHIWDAQHLQTDLHTESGEQVKVIYPGRWNTDAGPDFKEAIIKIGDQVRRGDVEIHLCSYDWTAHKHHENKDFNQVILHLVYEHNAQYTHSISENNKLIEILVVKDKLNDDINKLLEAYRERQFLPSDQFCGLFAGLDLETTSLMLQNFGNIRLRKKIDRFAAELFFSDFNQLLYQGVMEALGYSKNKFQMLQLALILNYALLKKFYYQGMTLDQLISILLTSSGLLERMPVTFPRELISKWIELYAQQDFFIETLEIEWHLFRIRPQNHPAIRLIQIADFLHRSLDHTFFYSILELFSCRQDEFRTIEFTRKLYQLFADSSGIIPDSYRLGHERIDIILVNIILPLSILFAEKMNYPDFQKVAWELYADFKALPENYLIENMKKFMDSSQRKLISRKAIYQQGLIQIYYSFCQHQYCQSCEKIGKESFLK